MMWQVILGDRVIPAKSYTAAVQMAKNLELIGWPGPSLIIDSESGEVFPQPLKGGWSGKL
jgi:hypothetical protein